MNDSFWNRHKDTLLVSTVGTTIGTVLAAAIIFVATSLAGLIKVSAADAGKTLAFVAIGLVLVIRLGLRAAEWFLDYQLKRERTLAERAALRASIRRSNSKHAA